MSERTDAPVNGALISLGAAAILDDVFSHWLVGLHRAVFGPGPEGERERFEQRVEQNSHQLPTGREPAPVLADRRDEAAGAG
jgi:hypothetical protein